MTDDAQRATEAKYASDKLKERTAEHWKREFLAERRKRVLEVMTEAKRLKEKGSGAMYSEDEARMLAEATLDLLIRYLELDHA